MALIDCPKCGQTISDRAVKCPHCGADFESISPTATNTSPIPPQSGKTDRQKKNGKTLRLFLFILLGLVIVGGVVFYLCGNGSNSSYDEIGKYKNYTYDQLIKLANDNDLEAITQLGRNAYNSEDYDTAFKWWIKAAENGYAVAQNNIGVCYENGLGVSQNLNEAIKWYRKAAEQDFISSQLVLGYCYYNGNGVDRDPNLAFKWFMKAAEQGDAVGQCNVGGFYEMGWSVDKDMKEAIKWYKKSAEQDYEPAQCALGKCYLEGNGIPKDYDEGIRWIEKSAEQGYQPASDILINEGIWAVAEADSCVVSQDSIPYAEQ